MTGHAFITADGEAIPMFSFTGFEPFVELFRAPIKLTEMEQQFVWWLCKDFATKEIAAKMRRSPKTVEYHRKQVRQKLNVQSDIGIVLWAIANKFIKISTDQKRDNKSCLTNTASRGRGQSSTSLRASFSR